MAGERKNRASGLAAARAPSVPRNSRVRI